MTGKPQNLAAREVITEAIDDAKRQGHKIVKLALARKLYKRHPELWPTMQACRNMIMYLTGAHGDRSRGEHQIADRRDTPLGSQSDRAWHNLPKSKAVDWPPWKIEGRRIGILADIHPPYHHEGALGVALETLHRKGIDHLLWLGDNIDCHAISRWEKDPRERCFNDELVTARAILDCARKTFPGVPFTWKDGNHEARWEKYMWSKAEELLDVPEFRLRNLLRFEDFEIKYVEDDRLCKMGKLLAAHGHEIGKGISSPVNPARGLYNKGKVHAIAGHWHRTSQHNEKDMNGHVVSVHSIGCLSTLSPRYLRVNKWNHGFARVLVDDDGAFQVENYRIINGRAYR